MRGVDNPLPKQLVGLFVYRYLIWRIRFAPARGNDATSNPVMNDPEADAVSVADLSNIEGVIRRSRRRDAVFVS